MPEDTGGHGRDGGGFPPGGRARARVEGGCPARRTHTRPPDRSAARGDCGDGTPWPAPLRHSRLAGRRADPRPPCKRAPPEAAQSAQPGARPHIPGAHAGSHRGRVPWGLFSARGFAPSGTRLLTVGMRRTTLGVPGSHTYARLGYPAHAPRPADRGGPRWLIRVQGEGDPRTPRQDQAGRPAPSGITR